MEERPPTDISVANSHGPAAGSIYRGCVFACGVPFLLRQHPKNIPGPFRRHVVIIIPLLQPSSTTASKDAQKGKLHFSSFDALGLVTTSSLTRQAHRTPYFVSLQPPSQKRDDEVLKTTKTVVAT